MAPELEAALLPRPGLPNHHTDPVLLPLVFQWLSRPPFLFLHRPFVFRYRLPNPSDGWSGHPAIAGFPDTSSGTAVLSESGPSDFFWADQRLLPGPPACRQGRPAQPNV